MEAGASFNADIPRVPWGREAGHFLGLTSAGELVLFDGSHVSVAQGQNLAREPRDTVSLKAAAPVARAASALVSLSLISSMWSGRIADISFHVARKSAGSRLAACAPARAPRA